MAIRAAGGALAGTAVLLLAMAAVHADGVAAGKGAQTRMGAARTGSGPRTGMAESQAKRVAAARTVVDEMGRRVRVPARVRRIVSLAPNVTDILYALGAGKKIVGVTDYTQIPKGARRKPSVGEPLEPSLERIAALEPDLVFVARSINRVETVEALERLRIPVYATDTHTVEGMLGTIRRIGALAGMAGAGDRLAARLQARLDMIRERLKGRPAKRVFFVVWEDPLITAGRNTFIADALRWAGARSVVEVREDWPHISLEEVVARQPDYLIFPAVRNESRSGILRSLRRRPGWRDLRAVRKGRVVVLGDAINRPSPVLVDAIAELARRLHPGAFARPAEPDPATASAGGGRQ